MSTHTKHSLISHSWPVGAAWNKNDKDGGIVLLFEVSACKEKGESLHVLSAHEACFNNPVDRDRISLRNIGFELNSDWWAYLPKCWYILLPWKLETLILLSIELLMCPRRRKNIFRTEDEQIKKVKLSS
jgi:hypothetical protein